MFEGSLWLCILFQWYKEVIVLYMDTHQDMVRGNKANIKSQFGTAKEKSEYI